MENGFNSSMGAMIPFPQLKLTSVNPHLAEVRVRAFTHGILPLAKSSAIKEGKFRKASIFCWFLPRRGVVRILTPQYLKLHEVSISYDPVSKISDFDPQKCPQKCLSCEKSVRCPVAAIDSSSLCLPDPHRSHSTPSAQPKPSEHLLPKPAK